MFKWTKAKRSKQNLLINSIKNQQVERNVGLLTLMLRTKLVIVITTCFYLHQAKYSHYRKIFKHFFFKRKNLKKY